MKNGFILGQSQYLDQHIKQKLDTFNPCIGEHYTHHLGLFSGNSIRAI